MGTIIQSIGSFLVGLIIAFIYSWRLTLVTLGLSPLLILGGIADAQMMNTSTEKNEDKSNFLQETLNNMKIVRSLNSEDDFIKKYEGQAEAKRKEMVKKGVISSLVMAFSQMGLFVVYGLVFYIGYKFIERGYHNLDQMLVSMFAIMFGAYGAGMANQFLGNLAEAKVSADMILTEVETPSKIESDPTNPEQNVNGIIDYKPDLQGNIEFKDVSFAYQGRKNWVVRKLNMTIEANKSFAFVGSSGCGKSTLMQLLMRFYDPQQGTILFNGFDIKKVNIQYLRSKFGTVRQEPSLFNGTINYNIKYNDDSISQPQIEEACVQANALDFIKDNEGGFERDVGNRGDKLSGGQKQRVAIARVIARQPIVYLFDEATSALDSKSEEIVQQAIEKISQNKTSITIAHRISTIKNSYKIFMLNKGKVVEEGNYDELIAKKRHFYKLAFS